MKQKETAIKLMNQALKVIQFDSSNEAEVSENKNLKKRKVALSPTLKSLKVLTILVAILGSLSLAFEVTYLYQLKLEIYIARLLPTILSFILLSTINTKIVKKYSAFFVHLFLFTLVASLGFVSTLIPEMFVYNVLAVSLLSLILSTYFEWKVTNQIIFGIYLAISFLVAAYFSNLLDVTNQIFQVVAVGSLSFLGASIMVSSRFGRNQKDSNIITVPAQNFVDEEVEDNLLHFLKNTSLPFFQISKEGEFKYLNPALKELVGLKNDEQLGEINFFRTLIKNQNVVSHIKKKLDHKHKVDQYRIKIQTLDGSPLILMMDCKLSVNDEGIEFYEGYLRDFTKYYERERVLVGEVETLRKTQQGKNSKSFDNITQAKGGANIISRMGHELRTPLNSVLGFLTLIQNGLFESEEELKSFSSNAKTSAEALLRLLNDIVEVSKINDGMISKIDSEFNLRDELDKVLSNFQAKTLEKNVLINTHVDSSISDVIETDVFMFSQIFSSIIENVIETSENNIIDINIDENKNSQGKRLLNSMITIKKCNLDSDLVENVLSTKSIDLLQNIKFNGQVINTIKLKELTSLLEGNISFFKNEEEEGSFTISIPYSSVAKEISSKEKSINNENIEISNSSRSRLLLVEDDPISSKVQQKLLEEAGYIVICVDNGKDAIEKVREGKLDIVLMDIELEDMNGLETTSEIRSLTEGYNEIPIIAVTAHSSMKDRERCLKAGMNDYISKPINITFLKMTIDQWLNAAKSN